MIAIKATAPAFPVTEPLAFSSDGNHAIASEFYNLDSGLSKREWFAGQALAGLCANPSIHQPSGQSGWSLANCTPNNLGSYALDLADGVILASQALPNALTPEEVNELIREKREAVAVNREMGDALEEIARIAGIECTVPEMPAKISAKLNAAPDLLKALEGVVKVADRKTDEFDLAHAAIAKAKGKEATIETPN